MASRDAFIKSMTGDSGITVGERLVCTLVAVVPGEEVGVVNVGVRLLSIAMVHKF